MALRSFKKFVIAVSGTLPGYKQAEVKALVEEQGATFSASVTDSCTHLITTQKDVDKKTIKYKAACAIPTCQVVSLSWLLESSDSKRPLAEKDYSLGSGQNGTGQDVQKEVKDTKSAAQKDTKRDTKSATQKDTKRATQKDTKRAAQEDTKSVALKDTKSAAQKDVTSDGLLGTKSDAQNNVSSDPLITTKNGQDNLTKKRNFAQLDDTEEDSNKIRKNAQRAGFKSLNIPVDAAFLWKNDQYKDPQVYIDDADLIWDATLTQTVAAQNNNKFYLIQLLSVSRGKQFFTWTRYGRVGEHGRSARLGNGTLANAMSCFQTKFKDKSGLKWEDRLDPPKPKKYTFVERNYKEDDGEEDEFKKEEAEDLKRKVERSTLSKPLQNLMRFIFNPQHFNSVMASMSYYPTKKLTKDAREAEEINQLDRQFQSLGMKEMTRLDHKSSEFTELSNYLSSPRGVTHYLRYQVIDIFRIERQGENDRFNSFSFANVKSDRRLLWHGSRRTNFGGILSQGLRIAPPEAPVNGSTFGKGIYLSDTSSNSANYCLPYHSGDMGLLLLCDAELGAPMLELLGHDYNAGENAQKEGKIAALAQGRSIPAGWKDAGCLNPALKGVSMPDVSMGTGKGKENAWLEYNEYIVYDVAQIRQRYLFYVHMS